MLPQDLRSTHSQRLERWLGVEQVANLTRAMQGKGWPSAVPIPVHGVPGAVYITADGDFIGKILGGQEVSALERANNTLRRERYRRFSQFGKATRQGGAFASLSALIAAATGGKAQYPIFQKQGSATTGTGFSEDLWRRGVQPTVGDRGAAAPGGTAYTRTSTGAIPFANPANANTAHFVGARIQANLANSTCLLIDRLFGVTKIMNSTAIEAVTGTFARYQSGNALDEDYIGGNFCYPFNPVTVLPATAHNWTVCQYTDQDSTAAQSFQSTAGISSCTVDGIDLAINNWFLPLAAGDTGVKALTQMQCSAAVATGTIDFVVAHAIAFIGCPVAQLVCEVDGINTSFNLTRIYDNACLALLDIFKPATTACTYNGQLTIVAE